MTEFKDFYVDGLQESWLHEFIVVLSCPNFMPDFSQLVTIGIEALYSQFDCSMAEQKSIQP